MRIHSKRAAARSPLAVALLLPLAIGCGGSEAAGDATAAPAPAPAPAAGSASNAPAAGPLRPGEPFPAVTLRTANPGEGIPAEIDLAGDLGARPVVMTYWIADHPRAEEVLAGVESVLAETGGDVAHYAVAVPRPDRDAAAIGARAREIGVSAPVLLDEGFELGTRLQVRTVPNVTIVGADGTLRLTNGASLVQELEYKIDLAEAIRRAARGDDVMAYGYLGRYFPVTELEGSRCPDFSAPLVTTKVEQRWKSLMADDRVNVLLFWSVECGHCRRTLPDFNRWVASAPEGVNVVSIATVFDEAMRVKTREFCLANNFVFPTLVDREADILRSFKVTSTPTFLIVGPDGTIDSAILTSDVDIPDTILARRDALLAGGS